GLAGGGRPLRGGQGGVERRLIGERQYGMAVPGGCVGTVIVLRHRAMPVGLETGQDASRRSVGAAPPGRELLVCHLRRPAGQDDHADRHGYLPVQTGLRFSRKALTPSRASVEWCTTLTVMVSRVISELVWASS